MPGGAAVLAIVTITVKLTWLITKHVLWPLFKYVFLPLWGFFAYLTLVPWLHGDNSPNHPYVAAILAIVVALYPLIVVLVRVVQVILAQRRERAMAVSA